MGEVLMRSFFCGRKKGDVILISLALCLCLMGEFVIKVFDESVDDLFVFC